MQKQGTLFNAMVFRKVNVLTVD